MHDDSDEAYDKNINCVRDSLRIDHFLHHLNAFVPVPCRECGLEANTVTVPNHVLVKLKLNREVW